MLTRDVGGFWYEVAGRLYRYDGPRPISAALEYDDGRRIVGYWEPFPEAQLAGLEELLAKLSEAGYLVDLVGHEEVGMPFGRKMDPGPLFPWERFLAYRSKPRRTTSSLVGFATNDS